MAKKARKTYWTPSRVSRLVMWHKRLNGQENEFKKIASHFSDTTKSAIYKKLGRLGHLNANWAKSNKK